LGSLIGKTMSLLGKTKNTCSNRKTMFFFLHVCRNWVSSNQKIDNSWGLIIHLPILRPTSVRWGLCITCEKILQKIHVCHFGLDYTYKPWSLVLVVLWFRWKVFLDQKIHVSHVSTSSGSASGPRHSELDAIFLQFFPMLMS